MQRKLFIATTNAGKLRDFRAAVETLHLAIETMPGMETIPTPDEVADTFDGNARLKAVAYSLHVPGQMVLADDSGLEVDALGGAPGVYSARYAEREGFVCGSALGLPIDGLNIDALSIDAANNACVLNRMAQAVGRSARYRCVLAAARDGQVIATGDGAVEGLLLREPRGDGGFGYDPLFLLPELGLTMAEIDLATKLTLSHRGRALRALLAVLDPQ